MAMALVLMDIGPHRVWQKLRTSSVAASRMPITAIIDIDRPSGLGTSMTQLQGREVVRAPPLFAQNASARIVSGLAERFEWTNMHLALPCHLLRQMGLPFPETLRFLPSAANRTRQTWTTLASPVEVHRPTTPSTSTCSVQ